MKRRLMIALSVLIAASSIAAALGGGGGSGLNFDYLKDEDRAEMQARFKKELWPLFERDGKNGCVGCHALAKTGGNMKMTGNLEKDFRMLVKDGFFIPRDSGSIHAHVTSKDRKKIMPPPGKGERWTAAEVELLEKFVADLDKKQQKKVK
jgi:hypothetical protein